MEVIYTFPFGENNIRQVFYMGKYNDIVARDFP